LALLGWDRRVAFDEFGKHSAQGLDAERQGRHVEKQNASITDEDRCATATILAVR